MRVASGGGGTYGNLRVGSRGIVVDGDGGGWNGVERGRGEREGGGDKGKARRCVSLSGFRARARGWSRPSLVLHRGGVIPDSSPQIPPSKRENRLWNEAPPGCVQVHSSCTSPFAHRVTVEWTGDEIPEAPPPANCLSRTQSVRKGDEAHSKGRSTSSILMNPLVPRCSSTGSLNS